MNSRMKILIAASLSGVAAIGYWAKVMADQKASAHTVDRPGYKKNNFYRSIGKLNGSLTCTGAFIATNNAPDAPAYVLNNGHCAMDPFDRASANRITLDGAAQYSIDFNYFHDSQDKAVRVDLESVTYATMKGTDIALLKTNQTIAQMRQKGLEPLRLSETPPTLGAAILVSGVPIKAGALQHSRCTNGRQVDVVENYWHWYGLYNNTCEGISSGSSGSPIFNTRKQIVGVINTTSEGAVGDTCYNGTKDPAPSQLCSAHPGLVGLLRSRRPFQSGRGGLQLAKTFGYRSAGLPLDLYQ